MDTVMNKKILRLNHGDTLRAGRQEECALYMEDGRQMYLLPGEAQHIHQPTAGTLVCLPRDMSIIGTLGAGPWPMNGTLYGVWGRYSGRVLSPGLLLRRNADSFIHGADASQILTARLRPVLSRVLADLMRQADVICTPQRLETVAMECLSSEALRQGVLLTCFRLERLGIVKGGDSA